MRLLNLRTMDKPFKMYSIFSYHLFSKCLIKLITT